MLTRIVPHAMPQQPPDRPAQWLDLSAIIVEVTSECPGCPIEAALRGADGDGWRAAEAGVQTVRLLFAQPQDIRRIVLCFSETARTRTQEFALHWSDGSRALQEIVRQQWNFSPVGSTSETEDYNVKLDSARVLELTINPDISGADAYASLSRLRLA